MDRLAFDLEVKLAGGEAADGTITGYGSVFGLLDRGGDIVAPGAFKGSLADWKRKKALPPMLWQHDPWTPIGVWTDLAEDEKGLKVTGQLALDVQAAADARALIAIGAVKGLSIGYRTVDDAIDRTTGVRTIKKCDLWEISLVTFAMLPEAQIASVKSIDPRALEMELRAEGFSSAMVTQKLLEDARIDVEGWIADKSVSKFSRKENAAFVNGDGVRKPKGFLAYATSAADDATRPWGTFQYVPTGAAAGFANANPADCLIDLIFSVKAGYRQGAGFLTARKTLGNIRKLKDGQGKLLQTRSESTVSSTSPARRAGPGPRTPPTSARGSPICPPPAVRRP